MALTQTSKTQLTALLTPLANQNPVFCEALARLLPKSPMPKNPTEADIFSRVIGQLITADFGGRPRPAELAAVEALLADIAAN